MSKVIKPQPTHFLLMGALLYHGVQGNDMKCESLKGMHLKCNAVYHTNVTTHVGETHLYVF